VSLPLRAGGDTLPVKLPAVSQDRPAAH
jgi:hypothetical protein